MLGKPVQSAIVENPRAKLALRFNSHNADYVRSAINSSMASYSFTRQNVECIKAEDYAQACIEIERELIAVEFARSNPHFIYQHCKLAHATYTCNCKGLSK